MPSKVDLRRTVTINLPPDEYQALANDALRAGHATPGTYAKALVRARGQAPAPIRDQRMLDREARWKGRNAELAHQLQQALAREQALRARAEAADAELVARPSRAQVARQLAEGIEAFVKTQGPPPNEAGPLAGASAEAATRPRRRSA